MNPNVRRDLVLGGTVVGFGLGLLAFAFFGSDESFRAPRWVVAAAAAAFVFGGSIPLRSVLAMVDIRPTGKYPNLAAFGALLILALIVAWIMISVGPEGAAVTLDIPLPFLSEAAERRLRAAIFYGVFGPVAIVFFVGSLYTLNAALPTMGRNAVVAMVAPVVGLMAWVAIEVYRQTIPFRPPVMFVSFDKRFPNDGYLARPEGRELSPRPGRHGIGLFVGGNGDWIDIEAPKGYDTSHGLTLEFWMKRENWVNPYGKGARTQQVASVDVEREYKGRPELRQIAFMLELTMPRERVGAPLPEHYAFRPAARVGEVRMGPARSVSIPALQWTHVAVVYDRFLFDTLRLYVDGRQVARALPWGSAPGFADIRAIRIGTASERNGAFRGTVDELKIFARALSDDEIAADASKGS